MNLLLFNGFQWREIQIVNRQIDLEMFCLNQSLTTSLDGDERKKSPSIVDNIGLSSLYLGRALMGSSFFLIFQQLLLKGGIEMQY